MAGVEDVISLAQGVVHWAPPADAVAKAAARATDGQLDQYGPANGLPELVDALKHKLREENGLEQVSGSAVPNVHEAGPNQSSDLLLAQQEQPLCSPATPVHLWQLAPQGAPQGAPGARGVATLPPAAPGCVASPQSKLQTAVACYCDAVSRCLS